MGKVGGNHLGKLGGGMWLWGANQHALWVFYNEKWYGNMCDHIRDMTQPILALSLVFVANDPRGPLCTNYVFELHSFNFSWLCQRVTLDVIEYLSSNCIVFKHTCCIWSSTSSIVWSSISSWHNTMYKTMFTTRKWWWKWQQVDREMSEMTN